VAPGRGNAEGRQFSSTHGSFLTFDVFAQIRTPGHACLCPRWHAGRMAEQTHAEIFYAGLVIRTAAGRLPKAALRNSKLPIPTSIVLLQTFDPRRLQDPSIRKLSCSAGFTASGNWYAGNRMAPLRQLARFQRRSDV